MEVGQSKFEGWAIVDALGHQRTLGYVTTEHFGQSVLFRVAAPAREGRTRRLELGEYVGHGYGYAPKDGAWSIAEGPAPESVRYVGAGSVYMLTPVPQDEVLKLLDDIAPRPFLGVVDASGAPVEKPEDEMAF